jgi:hypothetical protein
MTTLPADGHTNAPKPMALPTVNSFVPHVTLQE